MFTPGVAGLQGRVDEVAGDDGVRCVAAKLDGEVVDRVAGGGEQADVVADGVVAADEVGAMGGDDGQDAVGHGADGGLGVALGPEGELGRGEEVAGIGEGGHPAAVDAAGVPADVVGVQVGAEDDVDVLGREAGGGEGIEPEAVGLAVPDGAVRQVLVVADAGVDEDGVVGGPDDEGLEAEDDAVLGVEGVGGEPVAVLGEQVGGECGGRSRARERSPGSSRRCGGW